jgi:hypothetical protein
MERLVTSQIVNITKGQNVKKIVAKLTSYNCRPQQVAYNYKMHGFILKVFF